MAKCPYCKQELAEKKSDCPNCGKVLSNPEGAIFFGKTRREQADVEVVLTEKFLLLRKLSKALTYGAATVDANFGIAGSLASSAMSAAAKRIYGYFDLREISRIVYPFINKWAKKPVALRVVMQNGGDFVLLFPKDVTQALAERLSSLGIPCENGQMHDAGEQYCLSPFLTKDSFHQRIAESAKGFVTPGKEQYFTPLLTGGTQEPIPPVPQPDAEPQPAPARQNIPMPDGSFVPAQQFIPMPDGSSVPVSQAVPEPAHSGELSAPRQPEEPTHSGELTDAPFPAEAEAEAPAHSGELPYMPMPEVRYVDPPAPSHAKKPGPTPGYGPLQGPAPVPPVFIGAGFGANGPQFGGVPPVIIPVPGAEEEPEPDGGDRCPCCGKPVETGARFCDFCGERLR